MECPISKRGSGVKQRYVLSDRLWVGSLEWWKGASTKQIELGLKANFFSLCFCNSVLICDREAAEKFVEMKMNSSTI